MMTSILFSIDIDQDIGVTLTFDSDWTGSPEDGFHLEKATLVSSAVWLDRRWAERAADCNSDRTGWLRAYLAEHPDPMTQRRQRVREMLAVQWERDREVAEEKYAFPFCGAM
jgi:hypothetical protein